MYFHSCLEDYPFQLSFKWVWWGRDIFITVMSFGEWFYYINYTIYILYIYLFYIYYYFINIHFWNSIIQTFIFFLCSHLLQKDVYQTVNVTSLAFIYNHLFILYPFLEIKSFTSINLIIQTISLIWNTLLPNTCFFNHPLPEIKIFILQLHDFISYTIIFWFITLSMTFSEMFTFHKLLHNCNSHKQ